jgi:Fe-S-cluster containining protein
MPQSRTRKRPKKKAVNATLEGELMHVTSTMEKLMQSVRHEQQKLMAIVSMIGFYQNLWNKIEEHSGSYMAMESFYKFMDTYEKEMNPEDRAAIKCRKGCSFCCHIEVGVSEPEIDLIIDYIQEHDVAIDMARLELQQNFKDDKEHMLSPFSKCVFLTGQQECGIYPVRPMACRKHFVTTDPMLCDGHNNPENTEVVGVSADFKMESMATALLNLGYENSTLTRLLYKKLTQH